MINPGKAEKWAARSARLAVRLRENLKRRKAQARSRALREEGERKSHDSAEITGHKDSG